jgi:hypothetical protein
MVINQKRLIFRMKPNSATQTNMADNGLGSRFALQPFNELRPDGANVFHPFSCCKT